MKKILFATLVVVFAIKVMCQPHLDDHSADARARVQEEYVYRQQLAAAAAEKAAEQAYIQKIYSKDPWRAINGTTNLSQGPGWYEFQGEICDMLPNGVVFKGKWGQILSVFTEIEENGHIVTKSASYQESQSTIRTSQDAGVRVSDTSVQRRVIYGNDLFLVEGFPYPASMGQGYEEMIALDGDYFTYTNSSKRTVTIHRLVYGTPCKKLISQEEMEAANQKTNAKKQALFEKVLKSNQEAAERGDPYGLLRMGERFRDGDGVEKDLTKARIYLQKAADAGSPTAVEELKKLPTSPYKQ